MAKTTGAKLVAETLKGYGVTHVFFVPQILMKTLAAMEPLGIRRMMVHGEKAAAYMADGYARASRRPGVCMAQHVGSSNLAAGLRDAYLACSPVIAITGGPAPEARYRHAYQEIESFSQFDPTTKLNLQVDSVTRLPDMLRRAFREATIGAPGPVRLQLGGHHAEVTGPEADMEVIVEERFASVPPFRPAADPADVQKALALLDAAERPIIVAGGGVAWSQAGAEVVALAERLSIPVATSLNAKGTILETHPLSVGVCGTYSRPCANRAIAESDLAFYTGSHIGGQVTTRFKVPQLGTRVMHLDIEAREFGRNYPTCATLLGDARTVLQQMLDAASGKDANKRSAWLSRTRELVEEWRAGIEAHASSDAVPMRPERLAREISRGLPGDAVLISDTGHAGIWTGAYVDLTRRGQRLIRCAGSLGWGFPGAMGVKCALPGTPVVCFTGKQTEKAREMWGFNDLNFAKVAESFGCMGIRVERPADMPRALERALAAGRPVVIDAVTDHLAFAPRAWSGEEGGAGHY